MKKLLALSIALAAILIMVGCESTPSLTAPDVSYTVTSEGAELTLTITEVTDADGYIIYGDGVVLDTIAAAGTYVVTTPAKLVEVTAYSGDTESDATQIDCAPTTTTSLTVYGLSDPDTTHFSGLTFNATSGTAVTISAVAGNQSTVEFVFDDLNFTTMTLVNSGYYWTNNKLNTSGDDGTDFDAVTTCLLTGYSDQTTLAVNGVYDLWISNSMTWTDTDHFGKVKIESIAGSVATITVAYQKIGGLRWVVTP
jgi:hypothetical protein